MSTSTKPLLPRARPAGPGALDRLGIPSPLAAGLLGVLVTMTGVGVESNFVTPHLVTVLGSPETTVATIVTAASLATLVGSYLSGALSDLVGPRRVMALGMVVWVVFELLFLGGLQLGSVPITAVAYTLRGFGHPLFAFAFLVWVNVTAPAERRGAAVGWFSVAFTGGLPTLGSLVALGAIPVLGGGVVGETGAMTASIVLVAAGWALAHFGVHLPSERIAPREERAGRVLTSGLRLTVTRPQVLMGFLVRLINTAPEFGMFIVLPVVIAEDRGWGQGRWLLMTVCVYATNVLVNAFFGWVGDRIGWVRTVRWFGVVGSAIGLLAWWYVPQLVPAGSDWGYVLAVVAGCSFGCSLAGFVPMGAIMPALAPRHRGAAMAMYTTAAGGAAFLGTGVVAAVFALGGDGAAVTWTFVGLYACAFVMVGRLRVPPAPTTDAQP
ncbi:arabinose ABC transporter permease [Curtobacterium sp. MCPF17_047]|uniref:RbtT/DalT/CsbX family MFS transporter n=1 Tax=Curtobacterium sp. MCPF17_047 TaxID=2175654 RepID=UPI000DA87F99|nr:RbtT/DalT/CsbX family MFS transporter [Curtobacterium sp. MCPF17_047]PZF64893.1 arabinose ABC transporter permease [Curtobacterium sp. MCPF17_047]